MGNLIDFEQCDSTRRLRRRSKSVDEALDRTRAAMLASLAAREDRLRRQQIISVWHHIAREAREISTWRLSQLHFQLWSATTSAAKRQRQQAQLEQQNQELREQLSALSSLPSTAATSSQHNPSGALVRISRSAS